jgi:hypothetical protein
LIIDSDPVHKSAYLLKSPLKNTGVLERKGDAVVVFVAPDIVEANQYIDKYLRDSDPLTMIDTVTGESIRPT